MSKEKKPSRPWKCHIRTCSGGVLVDRASDGRPRYHCTKCGTSWTNGRKGEDWDDGVSYRKPLRVPTMEEERKAEEYHAELMEKLRKLPDAGKKQRKKR